MICGDKVDLRPLEQTDLEQIVIWRNDPEISRCFFTTFPLSVSGQHAWYQDLLKRQDRKLFVIQTRDGKPVGTVGFDHIDWRNQKAEFGSILIAREHWRAGYARDATEAILRFGFDHLNLNRVYLEVYAWNQAAIRLYEQCGFKVEGTLRQTFYSEGKFNDTLLMAILRNHWRSIHQRSWQDTR